MIGTIGESLIDIFDGGRRIGGCPFNVAVAASRMGAPVSFFGKVSSDGYGLEILERMIDNGVLFDPQLCNAPQGTLCSRAVIDGEGKASYVFDYKGTAACSLTEAELSSALAVEGDIDMLFIGSIALVMEPIRDAIMPAVRKLAEHPVLFLDPNVRPSMVSDPESYRSMILDLAGECALVRVSEEDLDFLIPSVPREEAEMAMLRRCGGSLIVTRGAEGSTWYRKGDMGDKCNKCNEGREGNKGKEGNKGNECNKCNEGNKSNKGDKSAEQVAFRVDVPCCKVEKVVDTIGCGDTFDGAVIAWLDRNGMIGRLDELDAEAVGRMLAYASKASALNCLHEGCEPPRRVGNGDDLQ